MNIVILMISVAAIALFIGVLMIIFGHDQVTEGIGFGWFTAGIVFIGLSFANLYEAETNDNTLRAYRQILVEQELAQWDTDISTGKSTFVIKTNRSK